MSQQIINIGAAANDRNSDPIRTAFNKVNQNFTELYTITGGTLGGLQETIQDTIAGMITNGVLNGVSVTYNDPNNTLNITNTNKGITTTIPTSSKGEIGDKAGMAAVDTEFLYLCISDYSNGTIDIWTKTPLISSSW